MEESPAGKRYNEEKTKGRKWDMERFDLLVAGGGFAGTAAAIAAARQGARSIAFCCISTGVFMFPGDRAAEIAVRTVRRYLDETGSGMKVIFNVFREEDERIYRRLLGGD